MDPLARPRPLAAALALVSLGALASAQTVVIDDDGGPGVDFDTISQAVLLAEPGTTIVVRDGTYDGFDTTVPVTITAAPGAHVVIRSRVSIRVIPAGETVVLSGLELASQLIGNTLSILDVDGTVFVEDSIIRIATSAYLGPPDAVAVTDSNALVLVRSHVTGAVGNSNGFTGGHGIRATRSNVHIFDSVVSGGTGASQLGTGGLGGNALHLVSSFGFVTDSHLTGGDGGEPGTVFGCFGEIGGNGGVGMWLDSIFGGGDPSAVMIAGSLQGGGPGLAATGCTSGNPGAPFQIQSGMLEQTGGAELTLRAQTPVTRPRARLTFEGAPGDIVGYTMGLEPDVLFSSALAGTLVLDANAPMVMVGTIDPTGTLSTRSLPFPGPIAYVQAFRLDPLPRVSSPAVLVRLPGNAPYAEERQDRQDL